ncbi:MAG: hypothetical protein ABW143_09000 [Acidimicrobiales bacterium]
MSDTRSGNPAKKAAAKKATAARRAEAAPTTPDAVEFDFRGDTYIITRDAFDDVELFELIEDGKEISAARKVLGDGWQRFKDAARTPEGRVPGEAAEEFLQAMYDSVGLGNSPASSGS